MCLRALASSQQRLGRQGVRGHEQAALARVHHGSLGACCVLLGECLDLRLSGAGIVLLVPPRYGVDGVLAVGHNEEVAGLRVKHGEDGY